ncbi:PREDICTED: sulfate transporter 2.1-like [Brassica oleracea var. oleracea]|nr:PREDICTED: sulfate transporter 2.1-like [Brassica oleracea var. oleracea]
MSVKTPRVLICRVKSALLCFANASSIEERIMRWINEEEEDENTMSNDERKILFVVLDMSNLMNVDTSGITALVELHNNLIQIGIELVIVNPKWHVFHKLNQAKFVSKIGGRVYLTIREALDACFGLKV